MSSLVRALLTSGAFTVTLIDFQSEQLGDLVCCKCYYLLLFMLEVLVCILNLLIVVLVVVLCPIVLVTSVISALLLIVGIWRTRAKWHHQDIYNLTFTNIWTQNKTK